MKTKFELYIPFRNESNEHSETSKLLIQELIEKSKLILIPLDKFGEVELQIEKTTAEKSDELKKLYPTFFTNDYIDILYFSSIIEFDSIYEFEASQELKKISKDTLNLGILTSIFECRFKNFLTFTQIAIPGSLLTDKGLFFRDNKYYHDVKAISSNLLSVIYDKKTVWPKIDQMEIIKVWDYIKNVTFILTKKSESKIESGLNAFSYLIEDNLESMQSLFWAMSGIEALYAEGEIGIGYQIDVKAKVFLGEPKEYKNILKKLYNFRSKFIHGAMRIPIHDGWLSNDNQDEFDEEFYKMECLATRLLTATLQNIIKKDLRKFDFEFKLIE